MENEIVPGAETPVTEGAPAVEANVTPGAKPVQTPAPSWNPQEYAYSYKGQTYVPKDRNHLLQLAEKGHAFAQRLGEVNKEWEGKFKALEPYQQFDQYLRQNPDFAKQVQELQQRYNEQSQQNRDPVTEKLRELEEWRDHSLQRDADQKLDSAKQKLQTDYKDYDWKSVDGEGQTLMQRVIKHALDTNVLDLEIAFRHLMWDEHNIRASSQGSKTAAQALQDAHKAGRVAAGGAVPGIPKPQFNPGKHSWDEIGKMAQAAINNTP